MGSERYLRFRSTKQRDWGKSLLWPVWVWKALYPDAQWQRLNIFQEAILGLARAGCRDRSRISELLRLEPDLIAYIVARQLIPNGWMDTEGRLTKEGERILDEALYGRKDLRLGYVFKDAILGNCLPRFVGVDSLPEVEPLRFNERGFPVFGVGRDSGKEISPFVLLDQSSSFVPLPPSPEELRSAFDRYELDLDRARNLEETGLKRIRAGIQIKGEAQRMWLWTYVYQGEAGAPPWMVADPFGVMSPVRWLREPLQEAAKKNQAVAKFIERCVGGGSPEEETAAEWMDSIERSVALEIMTAFSWIEAAPTVRACLESVLRRMNAMKSKEKAWEEDISSLLVEANKLVESMFQWLMKTYPVKVGRLPHYKVQREWKSGQASSYLNELHLPCLTDSVIRTLSNQRLDAVRSASKDGNASLKALLFATLIATVDHDSHPFRSIPSENLKLQDLIELAEVRNKKAGHATAEVARKEDAIRFAEISVEWIKVFKDYIGYVKEEQEAKIAADFQDYSSEKDRFAQSVRGAYG